MKNNEEIERKNEEKRDISISNHKTEFSNFFDSYNLIPKIHQLVTFVGTNLWSEIDNVQKCASGGAL